MKKINLFLTLFAFILFTSCDEDTNDVSVDFSQTDMLSNYADNLIVPAFKNYSTSTASLYTATESFTSAPDADKLSGLKENLIEVYENWAKVNAYQYGYAVDINLQTNTNSFPTQRDDIDAKIEAGDFNIESISSYNIKGLPAVDYLLNSDTDEAILLEFTEDENRGTYLLTVVKQLNDNAVATYDAWDNGYAAEFASNEGNDPSSSLSYIVNEYNKAYERCKNQRVGYALGKNSISGNSSPMSVESYYNQETLNLLKINVASLQEIFNGKDGLGLADYLDAYYKAGSIEEDLASKINAQFELIKDKLDECSDPFSDHIEAKDATVESLYDEMQKLVVMIKSEMSSALSVKITYQDSDGD
ncbi:imelysin family protein [Flammeovirga agarivorans]|uniref:Imelysin family protein n=1 Tax=Flammeovirga agarivorans TaxID=2726742 RepID=A0A7X8SL80_9BACT|nr:imelysin family protein [Flammeovirga agarivorans]NLR92279.1 imelysin family protein [Flammeovirga agarivorans]